MRNSATFFFGEPLNQFNDYQEFTKSKAVYNLDVELIAGYTQDDGSTQQSRRICESAAKPHRYRRMSQSIKGFRSLGVFN